jgi:chromate reductase
LARAHPKDTLGKDEHGQVQGRILRREPLLHLHQPRTLPGPDQPGPRGPRVHRPIGNLPLYSQDYDANYPPEANALKDAIRQSDAILFVTPEYNRSIPGALKNAIDWASRPWGENAFDHIPAGVIGASIGQIGTAVGQQSLRAVLGFCNARQMTAPEAYISFSPEIFPGGGECAVESTRDFLKNYMAEFRDHLVRVLTVLPRQP